MENMILVNLVQSTFLYLTLWICAKILYKQNFCPNVNVYTNSISHHYVSVKLYTNYKYFVKYLITQLLFTVKGEFVMEIYIYLLEFCHPGWYRQKNYAHVNKYHNSNFLSTFSFKSTRYAWGTKQHRWTTVPGINSKKNRNFFCKLWNGTFVSEAQERLFEEV